MIRCMVIDRYEQMFYNIGKELSGGSNMNIYKTCPDVHNERFRLRLVTQEDCEDLLKVYSDVKAVPLFNGDNCNGDDFYYATLERMQQAIFDEIMIFHFCITPFGSIIYTVRSWYAINKEKGCGDDPHSPKNS